MSISYIELLARLNISGAHPGSLTMTKKMLKTINLQPSTKVLDVGCGTGQTVGYIAQQYQSDVTGIDINQSMVNLAKKRLDKQQISANILIGQTENLPFKDGSFDVILSESVTSFTNIEHSLKEYERVLKSGGLLLMIEMTNSGHLQEHEKNELTNYYQMTDILSTSQWEEKLTHYNFVITNKEKINPYIGSPTEMSSSALQDKSIVKKLTEHHYLHEKYGKRISSVLYTCLKKEERS